MFNITQTKTAQNNAYSRQKVETFNKLEKKHEGSLFTNSVPRKTDVIINLVICSSKID